MDAIVSAAASLGYTGLFLLGLAEFGGLPVMAAPLLLVAGAMTAMGDLGLAGVVASVAAGGLLADLAWLTVARFQGHRIVGAACGLSANPRSCVSGVSDRIARYGTPFILLGKLLPGTGALTAAAAGLSGIGLRAFLAVDALALLLWASLYAGLGRLFAGQVEGVMGWLLRYGDVTLAAVVLLAAGLGVARLLKAWSHARSHRTAGESRPRPDPAPAVPLEASSAGVPVASPPDPPGVLARSRRRRLAGERRPGPAPRRRRIDRSRDLVPLTSRVPPSLVGGGRPVSPRCRTSHHDGGRPAGFRVPRAGVVVVRGPERAPRLAPVEAVLNVYTERWARGEAIAEGAGDWSTPYWVTLGAWTNPAVVQAALCEVSAAPEITIVLVTAEPAAGVG